MEEWGQDFIKPLFVGDLVLVAVAGESLLKLGVKFFRD